MDVIRRFTRQKQEYFLNNQEIIDRQNLVVLKFSALTYLTILFVFTGVSHITGSSALLSRLYIYFDLIHIAFCLILFNDPSVKNGDFYQIRLWRMVFIVTLLSFFLIEAVFPFPNQQSIFFPFPLLLIAIIFILNIRTVCFLSFSYVGLFLALVLKYKAPEVQSNEIYMAIGTLISMFTGYIIVMDLRVESAAMINQLQFLSARDSLTSLYNKRTFEMLSRSFIETKQFQRSYALIFFDLDNFKQINDQYGHPMGDKVLQGVAEMMRKSFYEKDFLCRFGGDEFVVLMVDARNEKHVRARLEMLMAAIQKMGDSYGISELSCSAGAAMKREAPESFSDLLSRADAALYTAKRDPFIQICFAPEDLGPLNERPDSTKRRILIVEDNNINRTLMRQILEADYQVIEAHDGQAALDVLMVDSNFSAIILDIIMPVMDGYELLDILRQDEDLRKIPVIITTTESEADSEIQALQMGAVDYIVKPYRPAVIMQRLKNVIRLRESNAGLL